MTSTAPQAGAADRAPEVQRMFDQLAPRYDLANRVLSLGLDQRWRNQAIRQLGESAKGRVLDLCSGTMDLTQHLLREGAESVVAIDFSAEMLDVGRNKFDEDAPIEIIQADARALPLPDACVDGILCGFGLRNVPELPKAVAECARVLRPGGRLVVLDFFRPETLFARFLQSSYNRIVLPIVGGIITGYGPAYRYLASSIEAFESRPEFIALMKEHGFQSDGQDMFPPVASMIWGDKPCD